MRSTGSGSAFVHTPSFFKISAPARSQVRMASNTVKYAACGLTLALAMALLATNTWVRHIRPKHVVVYTTAPNPPASERLASELIKSRAAACVQQIPGMKATYWWQGEVHTDQEELLLIKTSADKIDAVKEQIKLHHPYDTPELVVTPIVDGSEKYLQWIDENTINAPAPEAQVKN